MSKMTKRWLSIVTTLAVAFTMCFGCMGEVFATEGQVEEGQIDEGTVLEEQAIPEETSAVETSETEMPEINVASLPDYDDATNADITVKYGDISKEFFIDKGVGIFYKDEIAEEFVQVTNAKGGETIAYSAVNNAGSDTSLSAKGPKLSSLLAAAGVDTSELSGKTLKIIPNDGPSKANTVSWNQLVNTARYSFDEVITNGKAISEEIVKVQVPTIINIANDDDCGRLIFGQTQASERNYPYFLSGLVYDETTELGATIEILDSDYGQNAASIALAKNQGTVVKKESEINFDNKSWGNKQIIYFTTDGSEPTQKSAIYNYADKNKALSDDEKYHGPIAKAYGPMTVKVKAFGFEGYPSKTQTFNFVVRDAELDASKTTIGDVAYTGKAVAPSVTIENLTAGTDYNVSFSNNVKIGFGTATFTGLGKYYGSKMTKSFKVTPAKAKIKKLRRAKRSITVKFKSQKKSKIDGYQISCTDQSGNVKYAKAGKKKISKKVKKLKRKTVYNVRVRAYKTVNGVVLYGPWSDVKVKKTR